MSQRKFSSNFFILSAFIVLLFFGGFSLFGYFAGSMFIFYFILGFAIFSFILILGMGLLFRGTGKKDQDDNKGLFTRLTSNEQTVLEKDTTEYNDFAEPRFLSSSGRYRIDAYVITNPPLEEKCRISKLPLRSDQDVLQCPSCESYFIKHYLEDWLRENEVCPVCKFKLKIVG